ncbi:hypothetical protein FB567DRAFT_535007 [Paraphoma chrysanthemicola]|uniref:Secreted protein n=1 Tax=Paraphoma chrysanthemicola TaxID=798071 RepID=A0A8K0QY57_9PLEO|nr:hypothetical protein FB567DRAFT_535007 [Paraphoma chrysanthemicola]
MRGPRLLRSAKLLDFAALSLLALKLQKSNLLIYRSSIQVPKSERVLKVAVEQARTSNADPDAMTIPSTATPTRRYFSCCMLELSIERAKTSTKECDYLNI